MRILETSWEEIVERSEGNLRKYANFFLEPVAQPALSFAMNTKGPRDQNVSRSDDPRCTV